MRAFVWVGVEHPLHFLDLPLVFVRCCWHCCSLMEVEREVDEVHLVVLTHFLHLDVFHLWIPLSQLVVHLVVKLRLPIEWMRYSLH